MRQEVRFDFAITLKRFLITIVLGAYAYLIFSLMGWF